MVTKGEKMLCDLGYERHENSSVVWFEDSNEFGEKFFLEFHILRKEFYISHDFDEKEFELTVKEIQAIHQIMIDYGWCERENNK